MTDICGEMVARIQVALLDFRSEIPNVRASASPYSAKYDMLFLGKRLDTVYAPELFAALRKFYNIDAPEEQLLAALSAACASLGMGFTPLVKLTDLNNGSQEVSGCSISLLGNETF